MRSNRLSQRVFTLLAAVCLLCAAPAAAAYALASQHDCRAAGAERPQPCADINDPLLDIAAHLDIDKLSGTPQLPVPRSFRRWFTHAAGDENGACRAAWLRPLARDPPKTLRFCSLLI